MRSMIFAVLLGLPMLPANVSAQTMPQTAAIDSPATAAPASPRSSGITREQYVQRATERAAQRAGARFDQMDANHDGVLDRAETRAWRSQHPRHAAAAQPSPPASQ